MDLSVTQTVFFSRPCRMVRRSDCKIVAHPAQNRLDVLWEQRRSRDEMIHAWHYAAEAAEMRKEGEWSVGLNISSYYRRTGRRRRRVKRRSRQEAEKCCNWQNLKVARKTLKQDGLLFYFSILQPLIDLLVPPWYYRSCLPCLSGVARAISVVLLEWFWRHCLQKFGFSLSNRGLNQIRVEHQWTG